MAIRGKNKKVKKANVRKPAKKAAGKKRARKEGTHVEFGMHGLGKIMSAIHDAGLGGELGEHLGPKFVKIDRRSLTSLKRFVNERPPLSGLADEINRCDCPPDDPGCVYIPG
jgi:hypothetical protein